jgi:hypothetical protein
MAMYNNNMFFIVCGEANEGNRLDILGQKGTIARGV